MNAQTIMLMGLGDLAGHVLEHLARVPNIPRLVAADIREDWGARKINSALIGAAQFDLYPQIEFVQVDAFDLDRMAELLAKVKPDVIYNGMSLMSWWVITKLPPEAYKAIDQARYGPWYPMHLVPTYKLMQAIKMAGLKTRVVNAAFPDAVNPALGKVGLAPEVGIGNIDNMTSSFKIAAARFYQVPTRNVEIYMVAPHFVSYYAARFGDTGGAPYYLKVMVNDQEVTANAEMDDLLSQLVALCPRPGGLEAHPVVASSSCRIILGIALDRGCLGHAPGPKGLPGGYPVILDAQGAEPFMPQGLTLDKAIEINNQAQVFDGVEAIEEDGTVVITDKSAGIIKDLLDFDCKRYPLADCEAMYRELDHKYKTWAKQYA